MMEADVGLGVDDVYYLAAEIGKEFEKIIDVYGPEAVKSLMPKVIHALEHLESNALRNEHIEAEIADLKARISQLEYDKLEKAEFRNKFEQELEQIEDTWRKETSYLNELVARLREENNRLSSSLAEKETYNKTCRGCISEKEIQMIQKLQERVNKERERLHVMERKLQEKSIDMDNLQEQVETLGQMNRDLRWKQKHLQTQTRILVEEKADLQAQLQAQQRELQMIRQHLGQAVKENYDLATAQVEPNLQGKLVYDVDDPLRPRFTLDELRNILLERNTLKEKVSALEDELALYKPKELIRSESAVDAASAAAADSDLPVQGPINREPEEKLYPGKKGSGILKFFPSITWPRLKLQ